MLHSHGSETFNDDCKRGTLVGGMSPARFYQTYDSSKIEEGNIKQNRKEKKDTSDIIGGRGRDGGAETFVKDFHGYHHLVFAGIGILSME